MASPVPAPSTSPANRFDDVLKILGEGDADSGDNRSLVLEIERARAEREDKRAEREELRRREERAEASRADTMKMIIGLAGTILPALLNKPGMDPAIVALLANSGKGGMEEMKALMEMQRQADTTRQQLTMTNFMELLKLNNTVHGAVLEKALEAREEGGESPAGFAGVLHEAASVINGLGKVLPSASPAGAGDAGAAAEAPRIAAPAAEASAGNPAAASKPKRPTKSPAEVVLRQLMSVQQGKVPKKQLPIVRSAMVTVALQDDALTSALIDEDSAKIFELCLPIIQGQPDLMAWVQAPGVADWLSAYLNDVLLPLVEEALGDDEDDAPAAPAAPATGGAEPEVLSPATAEASAES